MTNTANPIKKIIASLNWRDGAITDRLTKAKYIQTKLTGNVKFPVPYPTNIVTLVKLGTDITALDTAITAAASKTKGTAAAEHAALEVVHKDLISIMTMVQNAMDNDVTNSETICTGAGYMVRKEAPHSVKTDTAVSTITGEVELTAKTAGHHQWQQSPDDGTTIINLTPTGTRKTTVTGLTSNTKLWFRNRQILTKGDYGDWSNWIDVRVM